MKTWTTVDKSDWPMRGEWDNEPDKAHWIDEKTGLDCLIVRGPAGALCGYVGLPESHPLYGKDYDDIYSYNDETGVSFPDVHGGLTFAKKCSPTETEAEHICHAPADAANENVWWFGFDCAHSGDLSPLYDRNRGSYSSYRDFNYVKRETESLAAQFMGIPKINVFG